MALQAVIMHVDQLQKLMNEVSVAVMELLMGVGMVVMCLMLMTMKIHQVIV